MAKISDIDVPSLLWQEGSAPGTPASTKWRLYFKTTGLFHKDDAGAEVGPLAPATGVPSGTSFPGGPANNDLFYRTDRDLLYFYDGTRWLGVTFQSLPVVNTRAVLPYSATQSSDTGVPFAGIYDLWLEDFQASFYVQGGTALGASHKWTCVLKKNPGSTSLATITIDSGASDAWRDSGPVAIDALLGTSHFQFDMTATKTGTPGSLYFVGKINWRVAG